MTFPTASWADTRATRDDAEQESALLDTASFTAEDPPPITRPSRWAQFLSDLEARGRDENISEDRATLGPFEKPEQAYSLASRISRGKFPGSEPSGKFVATARTVKVEGPDGEPLLDDRGKPVKQTIVWAQLNPDYVANPDAFVDSDED